jgi:hypothetical protein
MLQDCICVVLFSINSRNYIFPENSSWFFLNTPKSRHLISFNLSALLIIHIRDHNYEKKISHYLSVPNHQMTIRIIHILSTIIISFYTLKSLSA